MPTKDQPQQEATSILNTIANRESNLVPQYFEENAEIMGEEITLFREYASGKHRNVLSDRQQTILELPGMPNEGMPIFADYVDLMLQMLQSRLSIDTIDVVVDNDNDYEAATEWVNELLDDNRFDALQLDIHEATLRDGDTFVLCNWDVPMQRARFYRNLAYDGDIGVIPIIDQDIMEMTAAIKILNGLYRVYRQQIANDGIPFIQYYEVPLISNEETGYSTGESDSPTIWPPGVLPLVRFNFRTDALTGRGVSPILRAIPMQDALNHSLGATLVSAMFNAYRSLFSRNWELKENRPGMVHHAYDAEGPDGDRPVDLKSVGEGALTPYIEQNNHLIQIMGDVLQLLFPSVSGDNPSGEALKERVSGLVSQINKAQVKLGNAWEDLVKLAHTVETIWAPAERKPPPIKRFNAVWMSAEVRDDNAIIARLVEVFKVVPNQQFFLEQARNVLNLDDSEIARIIEEEKANTRARMAGSFGESGFFAADPIGMPDERNEPLDDAGEPLPDES